PYRPPALCSRSSSVFLRPPLLHPFPTRRSSDLQWREQALRMEDELSQVVVGQEHVIRLLCIAIFARGHVLLEGDVGLGKTVLLRDRKSTRLNSSHVKISYAVFCLKKKILNQT